MYVNKQKIATLLYETLDNLILEGEQVNVSIDKLLTPAQKHDLIMTIIKVLPFTDLERVVSFHNAFETPRETTAVISNFKSKELRFNLILEEALELGFALGFDKEYIYSTFINLFNKVKEEEIEMSLTNTFDALLDLIFVTYGAMDIFNLTSVCDEGMEEVYLSNMSKLIPVNDKTEEVIRASVEKLTKEGFNVESKTLNGNVSIINRDTRKILKPTTYFKPNLEQIIFNYLKQRNDD